MEGLYAVGAHFYPFAADLSPLEIGIASGLGGGIIMAPQKFASCDHSSALTAVFTTCSHPIEV